VVCERKNLEAQDLSFAPFRAGDVLRALVPRAARWLAAQVTAVTRWPLGWIMLAFQARLSMLFLCTSLLIAPPAAPLLPGHPKDVLYFVPMRFLFGSAFYPQS